MINTDVIIVGGGPAGAACAWKLRQNNIDFILIDKAEFPRFKPCAGWITPQVWRELETSPEDYPEGLTHFNRFKVSIKDINFTLKTDQYAIRRIEFDDWLLHRSAPDMINQAVKSVIHTRGHYVVEGDYSSRFIVGAGGTHCPVNKAFFREVNAPSKGSLIVAQEEEFEYNHTDPRCHLWFLQNNLPGYAWYVPKVNGIVNIGVGGSAEGLKAKNDSLKRHWSQLVDKLEDMGLVRNHQYSPVGHSYHLRGKNSTVRIGNAFLVGDAVGLATLDMGEGIGPAIQSGIRAANAILRDTACTLEGIPKYSFPSLIGLRR